MMRMMMKALLYYAACCHYPTLQTEPDHGSSSSTIPAVNIHVIAQQQLSGKIRSVITEVNLSPSLIRSIRVVSIHERRGTIKDGHRADGQVCHSEKRASTIKKCTSNNY